MATLLAGPAASQVEVVEVDARRVGHLPRGKEADGIIGDYVLRNAHIEALIGGDLPGRKANMSTNWREVTPGCLYDLCLRGSDNDQLTYLGPAGLEGPVSWVRPVTADETRLGVPAVRVVRTAARADGRYQSHDYGLGEGHRVLAILSTYKNLSAETWDLDPLPAWKEFSTRREVRGIRTGDATNPSDHQGYALGCSEWSGNIELGAPAERVRLETGMQRRYLVLVAPGRSPAEAFGRVVRCREPTGRLRAGIFEGDRPVPAAGLEVRLEDEEAPLLAYPDADGRVDLLLPPGPVRLRTRHIGRPPVEREVRIRPGETTSVELSLEPAAEVAVRITDPDGEPIPCKVQFIGAGDTPSPHFGPDIQARGCRNIYQSENGSFVQAVDPGEYRIVVTHGIEYDHIERDIRVSPASTVHVNGHLERILDTSGWVSTDFHNHSTPSGDNYCGTDDRVINLAVEQVEFAPTTEHNRLYDWTPHIERLGLSEELRTVPGIELTGPNAHLNAFPFQPDPYRQDGGAPRWRHDPRINAIVLRDWQEGGPFRWVHLNHPHVGRYFRDRDGDGRADGGYEGLELLIDAAEVWSLDILELEPRLEREVLGETTTYPNRTFAWLQLLNQGIRMNCIAVSDAHAVYGNACGGWRTYVRSPEDDPAELSPEVVIRSSRAGRMFVTTGPYLEVELEDGTGVGESTILRGPFDLHVRVQCTDWVDIDRVQVLVNGRPVPELSFLRSEQPDLFHTGVVKFDEEIRCELQEDAHLIVVAVGEGYDLRTGYGGSTAGGWMPCAFTNPIRVDTDGNGWSANGDTLGHPLPLGE